MNDKNKKKHTWDEAKQLCQLSDETIKMAKELRLSPGTLIKTLEISQQPGKLSVESWVHGLYKKQKPAEKIKDQSETSKIKPIAKIQTPNTDQLISFPSSAKVDKPAKTTKPNKSSQAEKKLSEIREIAQNIADDASDLPLKLWDLVQWMVENKKESLMREMMLTEELPDAAIFALDFILKDIGYRYPLSLRIKGKKGKYNLEEFELIPFAILLLFPVADEKLDLVPTKLLKTIDKLTKDKILRKAFQLNESPGVVLDPYLYHVDHDEWLQESSVMQYLDNYSKFLSNIKSNISPLTEDYKRPSIVSRENISPDVPHFCLVMRVLCGAILAGEEEALDVEEQLFESADSIESDSKLEARQKAWEKIEEIVVKEFEQHGIELPHGMFINPSAVELWDIPHVSISLSRILPLQLELHNAIAKLVAEADDGEIFTPTLYVSQHGQNDQIEEIRLAAYSDPAQGAFFRYVWVINPELDDPDDVASTIVSIASELEAEVVGVEGLMPKDYCSDCGEAFFYGPGEEGEIIVHGHEEYIN